MPNPVITNVALVTRYEHLALTAGVIISGASIAADGVLKRGTVLCLTAGKWHKYVHLVDVTAVDAVRILQDDVNVVAGVDAYGTAYFEGFFRLSSLIDATSGLVAGDLLLAAGFHLLETDEVRLK